MLAIDAGPIDTPILDETIGANLARTVQRHRHARGARVRATRTSVGPTASSPSGSTVLALRPARTRARGRATGSGCGARTTPSGRCCSTPPPKIGVILVNINPAYRSHELAYVLDQSGCRVLVAAPSFKTSDYVDHGRRGRAPSCPALERSIFLWSPASGTTVAGEPMGVTDDALDERTDGPRTRRPDQHPVHVGHDRVPEGRHAHPSQHPQQRLLRGRAAGVHRRATGCASRCPSTTASAWSWATSAAPRTAPRW